MLPARIDFCVKMNKMSACCAFFWYEFMGSMRANAETSRILFQEETKLKPVVIRRRRDVFVSSGFLYRLYSIMKCVRRPKEAWPIHLFIFNTHIAEYLR